MLLHELMHDAVADVSADPTLADSSHRQGLSIRRNRRALGSVGAALAAVTVAGALMAWPQGAHDDLVVTDTTTPSAYAGSLSGATVPITDRGVAAALAEAVDDVSDGTTSRSRGDVSESSEAEADLLLLPATGAGPAGLVMVNLQPLEAGGATPYTCDADYMTACTVRTLPGGDVLRTYRDDGDSEFGAASRRSVAEVLSPTRHLRVVVCAMNNNPFEKDSFRDQPVLDTDQLVEIATRPWWSRSELPREFGDAG